MVYLAKHFKPEKVVFLMDVDGLYTKFPGGKLIGEISASELKELLTKLEGSAGIDVTGGIKKKLEAVSELVHYTEEVWLVNGLVKNRLSMAIVGNGIGTIVRP